MEHHKAGPKDFFLWAGAMIGLYVGITSFLVLMFNYIDIAFPDALAASYYDPYSAAIRAAMASLIVMFPAYLLLMHLIRRDIAAAHERAHFWVRRWALFLTLFLAGLTLVIDLITLINYFLNGELTMHFVLKVLIVLLVAAGVGMHFLADIWGYWDKNPQYARSLGWTVLVLIVATIVSGFLIIGSPKMVRLYRFDEQKVNDLRNIQYQVVQYWQQKGSLPERLEDLNDPLAYFSVPSDPQGSTYEYAAVATTSFRLCATFNADSQLVSTFQNTSYPMGDLGDDLWYHGAGRTCFTRKIDPERYPVNTNTPVKPAAL